MLSEERIQELAEQFAVRFNRVCLRILCDMGNTLRKTGELTPSQARQLQQMFTYGADIEEMTKQLARAAGSSMEEIQSLYAQAAEAEQAWTKPFYNAKGITQTPFAENASLQNIVKAAAAVTKGNLRNMSRTTTVGIKTKKGFQPLGRFYQTTVDEAVSAVATGVSDYNSVIRQAVKDMGGGLRVQYESGYTRRLDSAMRQNIIDGVSYVAQETARQFMRIINTACRNMGNCRQACAALSGNGIAGILPILFCLVLAAQRTARRNWQRWRRHPSAG